MIAGVGVDMVDVAAFREQLGDRASTFVEGTFTAAERRNAASRPSGDPVPHLAARYAAKEAFTKAWSASNAGYPPALEALDLRDIELVNDAWGRPGLRLHGEVARVVRASELAATHVSVSHDGAWAVAVVVIERRSR